MEKDLWEYLKFAEKPIVLYGMGNGADKIIDVLESYNIKFCGVFATDGFVRKKQFHGFEVTTYADLKETLGDMIVLLCFGSNRSEVIENINRISEEQELYAPEVPVYGGGLFTNRFLSDNKEYFERVYSMLSDELSKKTFSNIINFKLSGKIKYLKECEVDVNEPYEKFFKLNNNETFLDLGAYNGDTINEFIERVGSYNRIYAVEPDIKNFKKLCHNTEDIKNIELHNVCISNQCKNITFKMNNGRNSTIGNSGIEIPAKTVDNILKGNDATFIKMDVEGEEINAISGAEDTISKFKPKMMISCYHRTDDLFSIPLAVNNIRDDYKLYMRHYPYIPAWDTGFYFK